MEVITGSARGTVSFWDLRTMRAYKSFEVHKDLATLTVHNCAPIFASGSPEKFIKISTFSGNQLGSIIKYHDGFLGQRIGPVTSLNFHPYKMLLAASSSENVVSIYGTSDGVSRK